MSALAINLGIILGTRLTVNNAIEWLSPYVSALSVSSNFLELSLWYSSQIQNILRKKKENEKAEGRLMSAAEEEYVREKYDVVSLIDDYLEVAIQFAFMTMFVSALPASVFITLVSIGFPRFMDAFV
jgi:hypothetical protein